MPARHRADALTPEKLPASISALPSSVQPRHRPESRPQRRPVDIEALDDIFLALCGQPGGFVTVSLITPSTTSSRSVRVVAEGGGTSKRDVDVAFTID
jgi:hypothetical protein